MGKTVGVIGVGYVGLPLATAFAAAGDSVVCVDTDSGRVEQLNSGQSYVEDVPSELVSSLTSSGKLRATASYRELAAADAAVIAVPTPLTENSQPDFAPLIDSATMLATVLRQRQLVVLESTTYPGTTRERLVPLLEESGLAAGRDFYCAYSPERTDPGRTDYTLKNTTKIVGGLTAACTEEAAKLYERVVDHVYKVSTPEVAELSKLLENIFRSVNIALVNEVAVLCDRMGIDVWEVIDAASTKPFGFMRFEPGPGLGGHCLPVDPFYLAYKAREYDIYPEFIELAGKINQGMPYFCMEKIKRALNEVEKPLRNSKLLMIGVAYKPGVADLRESPALKLLRLTRGEGADVSYHDPYVAELSELGLASVELGEALPEADLVAIVTAHPQIDYEEVVARSKVVLDFRGVTRGIEASNLVRM